MLEDFDPVASFRSVAERYIAFMESTEGPLDDEQFDSLFRLLPALYEAGVRLPDEEEDTEDVVGNPVGTEQFFAVLNRLEVGLEESAMGRHSVYWVVEPWGDNPKPSEGVLALDLAEIYHDLQGALALEAAGMPRGDLLGHWRFDFRHWGKHLVDALRILHRDSYG